MAWVLRIDLVLNWSAQSSARLWFSAGCDIMTWSALRLMMMGTRKLHQAYALPTCFAIFMAMLFIRMRNFQLNYHYLHRLRGRKMWSSRFIHGTAFCVYCVPVGLSGFSLAFFSCQISGNTSHLRICCLVANCVRTIYHGVQAFLGWFITLFNGLVRLDHVQ